MSFGRRVCALLGLAFGVVGLLGGSVAMAGGDLSPVTLECIADSAHRHGVTQTAMLGLLAVERGRVGERTPNPGGRTYDYGPFQINTIWFEKLSEFGITREDVRDNGCVNAEVAAWILGQHWDDSNPWRAVGNYHSQTPEHHWKHRFRVLDVFERGERVGDIVDYANSSIQ